MKVDFVQHPLFFGCFLATLALDTLVTGYRGLVIKKPFFSSWRWFYLAFGFYLAFLYRMWIRDFYETGKFSGFAWGCLTVLSIAALWLVWRAFVCREYHAHGFSADQFRDSLYSSLEKLDLPFKRTPKGVKLLTLNADIHISFRRQTLRMSNPRFRRTLDEVVESMESESRDMAVSSAILKDYRMSVIVGIVMLVGSAVFLVFLL